MTKAKLLIAVSPAIRAESWTRRNLNSIDSMEYEVFVLEENDFLERILKEQNIPFKILCKGGSLSRSEIRKALSKIDYLLMLWDGKGLTNVVFEARLLKVPSKVIAIQVTEVVNKDRGDSYDAYIGRGTPWGNPFPVGPHEGQYSRDEAIKRFKDYFESEILGDESKRRGLLGLRGMRIACHCKPFACHGDVIASYLNSLDPDDIEKDSNV